MIKLNFNKDLTNFDLINLSKELHLKLNGVYMKDELKTNLKNGNYILNLENHNQGGSHWVCFIKHNKSIYYFDSFGVQMPQNELDIFKQNHDNIFYSNVQIQSITSILCGYFCIAYLYCVNKFNGNIDDKILKFQKLFNWNNQKNNDKVLKLLYKQIIYNNE